MTMISSEKTQKRPAFQEVRKQHTITADMLIEDAQIDPGAFFLLDTWGIGEVTFLEIVLASLSRLSGITYHAGMLNIGSFENVMNVRGTIAIFPFLDEAKRLLIEHGCTFQEGEEDTWEIQFPEGTICTPLIVPALNQQEEHSRIILPDGLKLREVYERKRSKSWLSILIHEKEGVRGENA